MARLGLLLAARKEEAGADAAISRKNNAADIRISLRIPPLIFRQAIQPREEPYALAPTAAVSVAGTLLSSPLAFCWPVCPPLRMSMPPLKYAPSSIEMRAATTSPVSDPSLRISTRSLAVRLPRTFHSTTISLALTLSETTPLRPTVTRLPERLIDPSTRQSRHSGPQWR